MSFPNRHLSILFGVVVLLCGLSGNATSKNKAPAASGTITATATSVAAGVGWSWGKGTLTLLDGSQYEFKISGLDVVAAGAHCGRRWGWGVNHDERKRGHHQCERHQQRGEGQSGHFGHDSVYGQVVLYY